MQVFIAKKSLVCFEASGSVCVGLLGDPVMCYGDPTSTVRITFIIQAGWMLVGQVRTLVLNLSSCRVVSKIDLSFGDWNMSVETELPF